jgi:nucleoside 2-deoxyribosyltransferase
MDNVLAGKKFYLSGSIEHDNSAYNWRVEPCRILKEEFGIVVFDPFADPKQCLTTELDAARKNRDFNTIVKIAKGFVRKDLAMIDRADALIAYLPYMVPTTGTHHEIILSNSCKKPTLLICPQGREFIPLWYYGFIPHEFMFDSWKDLYGYLHEVNNHKHTENNRWAIVYELV